VGGWGGEGGGGGPRVGVRGVGGEGPSARFRGKLRGFLSLSSGTAQDAERPVRRQTEGIGRQKKRPGFPAFFFQLMPQIRHSFPGERLHKGRDEERCKMQWETCKSSSDDVDLGRCNAPETGGAAVARLSTVIRGGAHEPAARIFGPPKMRRRAGSRPSPGGVKVSFF